MSIENNEGLGLKVILLRLYNGDYVIGESIDTDSGNTIDLSNPRALIMIPSMNGEVRMGMQTLCPFTDKAKMNVSIRREQVMFIVEEDELSKDLINGYKSHITGIRLATAEEAAAMRNSGDIIF